MDIAAYFALIIVLVALLVKAADLIEDAFVILAKKLGINPFIVGFAVLGVASSLPEIAIAFSATQSKEIGLSIGNLLGASLVLLTLVISANAIVHKGIPFNSRFGFPQIALSMGLLLLGIAIVIDQKLTAFEGAVAMVGYAALIAYLAKGSNHHRLRKHATIKVTQMWRLLLKASIGIIGLLILSHFVVETAIVLADKLQISASLVGLVILGLGTNTPEITILVRSIGKDKDTEKLAVGNFIGSACTNVPIIGILALLNPGDIPDFLSLVPVLVLLSLAVLLFGLFSWTNQRITWKESVLLMALYASFLIVELSLMAHRSLVA